MLKTTIVKQPTEEDPEEGIKDLVEIMVKKMVSWENGREERCVSRVCGEESCVVVCVRACMLI